MTLTLTHHPRFVPAVMVVLGVAAAAIMLALGGIDIGGRGGGRAIFIIGIAGIAVGTGLVQLLWPPPPKRDAGDGRHFFSRATWPQKILYIIGGLAGIVAVAVAQTIVSGKY